MILVAEIIGGLLLLIGGAELLVRGGSRLALRLGVSALVVGLTVVGFGTSSPELTVSVLGAWRGISDIAVGNVVGSNICNVGLILGLAALIRPIPTNPQLLKSDVPVMFGFAVLAVLFLGNGRFILSRMEGAVLVLLFGWYLISTVRRGRIVGADGNSNRGGGWPRTLAGQAGAITGGLALLVEGGSLLVDGAVGLARQQGISEAFISLTVVAVGTSLPELATSALAVVRKHGDIAVGNVVGSNIFNIGFVLGVSALVRPLPLGDITMLDLTVMLGSSLVVLPLLWTDRMVSRWEGAAVLAGYCGYLWYRA